MKNKEELTKSAKNYVFSSIHLWLEEWMEEVENLHWFGISEKQGEEVQKAFYEALKSVVCGENKEDENKEDEGLTDLDIAMQPENFQKACDRAVQKSMEDQIKFMKEVEEEKKK